MLKEIVHRLEGERVYEVVFYEEARLYEYLTGEELPVKVDVLCFEGAWRGYVRPRSIPVSFRVEFRDKMWRNRTRRVTGQGLLEIRRVKSEVVPIPKGLGGEVIVLDGKKFVRISGFYSTIYDVFLPENDQLQESY